MDSIMYYVRSHMQISWFLLPTRQTGILRAGYNPTHPCRRSPQLGGAGWLDDFDQQRGAHAPYYGTIHTERLYNNVRAATALFNFAGPE